MCHVSLPNDWYVTYGVVDGGFGTTVIRVKDLEKLRGIRRMWVAPFSQICVSGAPRNLHKCGWTLELHPGLSADLTARQTSVP
jgi:hypothetical protein